jgi:sigma-B regulation protein RsbU (phosphoserine phosphatase)
MSTSFPKDQADVIDLQQQVFRLQALLEVSRQVHAAVGAEEVLQSVLRIVVRELEMAGAHFPGHALTVGKMRPEPWDECPRFALLSKDGEQLAELVVDPGPEKTLSLYEQDFLEGLVLQAGVAVENAQYHERTVEWARVQQDLNAAREIQRSLLPQQMQQIPGYSVAIRSTTCYEVGGDYVDILALPDGSEIMVVADVAGKGLASAIVATSFRSAFRAMALAGLPLAELAARMNQQHYGEGAEARRRYVTAIFLKLNPKTHALEVVNAGHNQGFLLSEGNQVYEIEASGTPIGLVPMMQYTSETLEFRPGSRLLFYTDGLTEVFCGDDEFGPERLLATFRECKSQDCTAILKFLWQQLLEFSRGEPQHDDMTALALVRIHGQSGVADGVGQQIASGTTTQNGRL